MFLFFSFSTHPHGGGPGLDRPDPYSPLDEFRAHDDIGNPPRPGPGTAPPPAQRAAGVCRGGPESTNPDPDPPCGGGRQKAFSCGYGAFFEK